MNVLLCSESHFIQVGQQVYCPQTPPDYFQRYREAWEEVVIVGRLAYQSEPPAGAPRLNMSGIRLVGLPDYRGPWQYARHRWKIRRVLRELLSETDCIIFRGGHQISAVVYSLIRRSRRPYGIEVVGDPFDSLAPGSANLPLRGYFRRRFVRILERMCHDAFASAYVTAQTLQRRYPPGRGKFTTDFSDVLTKPLESPRDDFPSTGPFRLIAIGTMATMYKGHDVLLRSVAQSVQSGLDLQLVMIGDGQRLLELKQLAARLGISERVAFLGLLPFGDAVNAEFDRAHLLVMPSRQEGLPRSMIEAMARGLPCIGSAVGGIPELLDPDELFPPSDPSALAAKLAEVLHDPIRMAALSSCNLRRSARYAEPLLRARRLEFYRNLRSGTEAWLKQRQSAPATAKSAVENSDGWNADFRGQLPAEQTTRALRK